MVEDKNVKSKMQDSLDDFLGDIDEKDLEFSAGLDISPKLTIEDVGLENAKEVEILSEPYQIEIPVEKSMSEDNKLYFIDMEYKNVKHQFIAQAKSFRYQYGVIMKSLGFGKKEYHRMIGAIIKIWLEWVNLPKFGNQKLYKVSLIRAPLK